MNFVVYKSELRVTWNELEKSFNKAVAFSFSQRKALLTFCALAMCGIFVVFCRALALSASDWVAMSLAFLPILMSAGVLLSLGVLLVRMYSHETKQLALPMSRLFAGSFDVILGTLYLSVPPVLIYLALWIVLGFFYLLRGVPGVGDFFSVLFAFGPFLLILSSIGLCLFNLCMLFFVAPAVAIQQGKRLGVARRILFVLKGRVFSAGVLLLVALIPLGCIVFLLCLSAFLTNGAFSVSDYSLSVALEWFMIMLPFCAVLTPAVVFFFNFSAESYWLLQRKIQIAS
jgi:hypothetical protein